MSEKAITKSRNGVLGRCRGKAGSGPFFGPRNTFTPDTLCFGASEARLEAGRSGFCSFSYRGTKQTTFHLYDSSHCEGPLGPVIKHYHIINEQNTELGTKSSTLEFKH